MKKFSVFPVINATILSVLAFLCLFPFIHLLALSFSSANAANQGVVWIWPVDFNLKSYEVVVAKADFWRAALVSVKRLLLGVPIQMITTILAAYPLSKPVDRFRYRTFFSWLFFFTMLFSGGMIPMYLLVRQYGLMDTIWALVIPSAVPVFNVVILMNYFRTLPAEIEEAAIVDGANQWKIMWRIWVPLALPSIATLTLFSLVGHWNAWFDGIIYMNFPENYPLQSYMRTIIQKVDTTEMTMEQWKELAGTSERTIKAAQIMVASLPMLVFYPYLQKYFVGGITLGGVKG
ncbi:MAG: carbohydrate ABC transporter permease [Christensenellales bacterium]|jgi:putative aldouronate transport system permease protein